MGELIKFLVVSVMWCLVSSANLNHTTLQPSTEKTTTSRFNLVENDISNCSSVKPIFEPKNITLIVPDRPVDGEFILCVLIYV